MDGKRMEAEGGKEPKTAGNHRYAWSKQKTFKMKLLLYKL